MSLKQYKCKKLVLAEPMTFGVYVDLAEGFKEAGVPHGNPYRAMNADTEGYHVVYSSKDEGQYHSWSPKAAFEEGYDMVEATGSLVDTSTYAEMQKSLFDEQEDYDGC